ncbi:MAG: cytochrome b [Segniliparus sp.]|uniref:cytochrome b n=1 Tax=Segniliparus sp. TaxID=2804064 RepID=UPI003F37EC59
MTAAELTAAAELPLPARTRYGLLSQLLHWSMAAAIYAALVLGALLSWSLGGYHQVLAWHKLVGLVVLALAAIRIPHRILHRAPPQIAGVPRWERALASAADVAMYVLFVVEPLLGWATVNSAGDAEFLFGAVRLPQIVPADPGLYLQLHGLHAKAAWLLLLLVTAHIGAVLFHTVGLRNGLLRRMLPGSTTELGPKAS